MGIIIDYAILKRGINDEKNTGIARKVDERMFLSKQEASELLELIKRSGKVHG